MPHYGDRGPDEDSAPELRQMRCKESRDARPRACARSGRGACLLNNGIANNCVGGAGGGLQLRSEVGDLPFELGLGRVDVLKHVGTSSPMAPFECNASESLRFTDPPDPRCFAAAAK